MVSQAVFSHYIPAPCCSNPIIINRFYWSTVGLQCCICFCCTKKWTSYMYIYVRSLLSLLQPRSTHSSSQRTMLSFLWSTAGSYPLLCTWQCTCHFQAPNSSYHPPLPCPLISFLCLCLYSYPQIGPSGPFLQIPYACINIQFFSLSDSLHSVWKNSRSIRVSTNDSILFLFNIKLS